MSSFKLILSFYILFALKINYIFSLCQPGWTVYVNSQGESCYRVFNSHGMTIYQSQTACSIMNSYLATINDQNEFNFMTQTLLSSASAAGQGYINGYGNAWVILNFLNCLMLLNQNNFRAK